MKTFKLPDLGEGLQEAEIVAWHVAEGEQVVADQPLVSVETAKAVVEVPCPYAGRIVKLHGKVGDAIAVGAPLVEFESDAPAEDKGTVVGEVAVGKEVVEDKPAAIGVVPAGVKATPAVRALAARLKVDLGMVTPSGPDGLITAEDIQRVARIIAEMEPLELLRGVRKAMAANMALAHAEVAPVTIFDDADIDAWAQGTDITSRLVRALVAGCRAEPALNAIYDAKAVGRRVLKKIDLGLAVDTDEGLFVPVMRDVATLSLEQIRSEVERLKAGVQTRSLSPAELRGNTITLSNYGNFAGRYASPVVLPPTVAILGAGRARAEVVAVNGQPAVHRILPLSLTFDHRAVTGGEAARFLATVIADLQQSTRPD